VVIQRCTARAKQGGYGAEAKRGKETVPALTTGIGNTGGVDAGGVLGASLGRGMWLSEAVALTPSF
jgi:hypothetical protein